MEEGNTPSRSVPRQALGAAALVNPNTPPVAGWSNITPGRGRGRGATRERAVVSRMGTLDGPVPAAGAYTTVSQSFVMESDLQPALLEERKSKDGFTYVKHGYGGIGGLADVETKKREFSDLERGKVQKKSMHSMYYDFEDELPESEKTGVKYTDKEAEDLKKAMTNNLLGRLQQLSSLGYARDTSKLPPVQPQNTAPRQSTPDFPPPRAPSSTHMPPPANRTAFGRSNVSAGAEVVATAQQRRLSNVFARTNYAGFTTLKNQELMDFYATTRHNCMQSVTRHELARRLPSHPYIVQTEAILLQHVCAWGDGITGEENVPKFTMADLRYMLTTGCGLRALDMKYQHYPSLTNDRDTTREARRFIRVLYTYSMDDMRDWAKKEDPDRLAEVISEDFVTSWIEDFLLVALVLRCEDAINSAAVVALNDRTYSIYSYFYFINCPTT